MSAGADPGGARGARTSPPFCLNLAYYKLQASTHTAAPQRVIFMSLYSYKRAPRNNDVMYNSTCAYNMLVLSWHMT